MMDAMPDGFYGYGENIRSVWRTLTEKRTLSQLCLLNFGIGQRQSDLRQNYIVSASLDQQRNLSLPEVGSNS